jgi:hypothetical protein
MKPEGSLPHLQVPTTCPYPFPELLVTFALLASPQRIGPSPKPWNLSWRKLLRWGVVSTSSNPQARGLPLSAVRDCLFNIFAAILRIWRPVLHRWFEDAPCCCDRDPFMVRFPVVFGGIKSVARWYSLKRASVLFINVWLGGIVSFQRS